jgi:hypothetical protein
MSSKRKVKIMLVTPDVAQRWLNESNTHNRPLRNATVDRFAEAMKRGEWKLTAEPIAFCGPYNDECNEPQGITLINGQHRLWAIVMSQVPAEMTVWWGCEAEEFTVIDQGATRTLGDVLATTRRDLSDPTLLASVCSSIARYAFGFTSHTGRLSPAQLGEILTALQPEILAVADYEKKLRKTAPRTVVSALFLARVVNPSMADLIVRQLSDAVGFTDRDPTRALHLYITEALTAGHRDTPDVMHYKVCHAIAARLRGEHIRLLRITGEGLAWLRDGAKPKIGALVASLHGGKVPHNFYSPKLLMESKAA